ncbi:hypothetical protein L2E82_40410 [Cichorium intybus]|uniref:Uncharacterized protein n=1 Tax=Cichorium intybus TaxID=13427 RepID=A0ACB9AL99_CICIN|nr:hypothetical protein L2E82_40410 [Cichorium intybus]
MKTMDSPGSRENTSSDNTVESVQRTSRYDNHRTEIQELVRTRNFRNNELLLPYPNDEDTTSIIKAVESFENSKTAWVTGRITLPVQERGFSYTACANCQKPLEADITWIGENLHDAIAAAVQSSPITAFIRAYTTHYRGTDQTRINIVKAYTSNENPSTHTNPPPLAGFSEITTTTSTSGKKQVDIPITEPIQVATKKDINLQTKDKRPMKKPK